MLNSIFSGKRFFVTGATGFKGTWLSLLLKELGAEVTGYSIDIPTTPSVFETVGAASVISDIRGDILDMPHLEKALHESKPDYVLHLAAQPLVRVSLDNPLDTYRTNVLGTANVLDAIRRCPSVKAVLVVTTDKVYEASPSVHPRRESDPLGGDDPYSASKACAEIVTQSYFQSYFKHSQLPVCTVRAGNVIGGGDWAEYRIIPDMIRAVMAGRVMQVRSPQSVRPWQHVLEPVVGYLVTLAKLVQGKIPNGEAFNLGPRPESHVPVSKLTEIVKPHFPQLQFQFDQTGNAAKGEMLELRLDWQKAYRMLGWMPLLNLEESIDWTCDWYRTYLESPQGVREKTLLQIREYLGRAESFFAPNGLT
jgi:CDP-glucose 4,6-dehydratase